MKTTEFKNLINKSMDIFTNVMAKNLGMRGEQILKKKIEEKEERGSYTNCYFQKDNNEWIPIREMDWLSEGRGKRETPGKQMAKAESCACLWKSLPSRVKELLQQTCDNKKLKNKTETPENINQYLTKTKKLIISYN